MSKIGERYSGMTTLRGNARGYTSRVNYELRSGEERQDASVVKLERDQADQAEQRIRILLIDSQALFRAGLRLLMEREAGLEVMAEAGTRAEALAAAASAQPDIILIGLDEGNEEILDLIPELREAATRARLLVLSGTDDGELLQHSVLLGATGIVSKNDPVEVLVQAINKVRGGEVWLDGAIIASVLDEIPRVRGSRLSEANGKINSLTEREREVVALIGEGIKNRQIADRLFISEATVRHHLTSIFAKLGVSDRFELTIFAYRHGLATPPR